jgi:nucleotide-binding universal stress UspA family protein
MFKRILLPTDGSDSSKRVIADCMKLAKQINAEVIGLIALPPYIPYVNEEGELVDSRERLDREWVSYANRCLDDVRAAAKDAGVKCQTFHVIDNNPYEAIVETAGNRRCDLIAMASHGRKGVKGFLLGSETQKVLTHCRIPVLVFR